MRPFLHIVSAWHPTLSPAIPPANAQAGLDHNPPQPQPGAALRLAAALAALGQALIHPIAPIIITPANNTQFRPWHRLTSVLSLRAQAGDELPRAAQPRGVSWRSRARKAPAGDGTAAIHALGTIGVGSNHCAPGEVPNPSASSLTAALIAVLSDMAELPDINTHDANLLVCYSSDEPNNTSTALLHDDVRTLLLESHVPVAVAPMGYPGSESGIRRITCTFDGSTAAQEALAWATELALWLDAEIRVAGTIPPPVDSSEAVTRTEPLPPDPVLSAGCRIVGNVGRGDIIATADPDWAMVDAESTPAARWLPEELLVFGHAPSESDAPRWLAACQAFGVPFVAYPAVFLPAP